METLGLSVWVLALGLGMMMEMDLVKEMAMG
jgi:hypothetical protein